MVNNYANSEKCRLFFGRGGIWKGFWKLISRTRVWLEGGFWDYSGNEEGYLIFQGKGIDERKFRKMNFLEGGESGIQLRGNKVYEVTYHAREIGGRKMIKCIKEVDRNESSRMIDDDI